ncbi:conserved hypothetical protein [Perkinsus marinus ATCC 50983]|uniref:EF-hand domain-containing protein n=1 Tax=Perkinsus marinus (strain ATCC 50983 / TXsc) TaxID=423536 RepID=C5KCI0_PERM5|nr:conserved hypothetical protein [Perkinsus marinus ATCC 50983]EER17842.1 conserved hypothetical protein [Perkinsus marinus ATCC 50983]|eukprot:XP_002786046.1 conserved hypothetical protein [Perkinsus marinus ATCC 50983]
MSAEMWLPKAELEKNPEYIECREYMARHRIPELLNDLLASVAFHKPEGGREAVMAFMAQQLERRSKEGAEAGGLFDMKEIESVFRMADLLKQGTITREQCRSALKALACSARQEELIDGTVGQGGKATEGGLEIPLKVDMSTFVDLARRALNLRVEDIAVTG